MLVTILYFLLILLVIWLIVYVISLIVPIDAKARQIIMIIGLLLAIIWLVNRLGVHF
jgi:hypothetical protein